MVSLSVPQQVSLPSCKLSLWLWYSLHFHLSTCHILIHTYVFCLLLLTFIPFLSRAYLHLSRLHRVHRDPCLLSFGFATSLFYIISLQYSVHFIHLPDYPTVSSLTFECFLALPLSTTKSLCPVSSAQKIPQTPVVFPHHPELVSTHFYLFLVSKVILQTTIWCCLTTLSPWKPLRVRLFKEPQVRVWIIIGTPQRFSVYAERKTSSGEHTGVLCFQCKICTNLDIFQELCTFVSPISGKSIAL